ncbi:MAG TPA: Coagulation factor 5/8 type domain-containing protein [Solirubrobacteraceae bacterium]|nr:Coagulation factor 5/8 type domain-containing protein [Solirubrobacteraceae bacterium]
MQVRPRQAIAAAAAVALTWAAAAPAAAQQTRHSLVGGCYALTDEAGAPVADGQPVRLQATALGRYLLYLPDETFLAANEDGTVGAAGEPSPSADWVVEEAGGGTFTIAPLADEERTLTVRFTPADGCAVYPEADLNATGRPPKAPVPYRRVGGLLEGHMHWMTYEYFGRRFHCGRPWHPYGIPYALPDCSEVEGPQGTAAPLQNTLNYGNPGQPHDTSGYPKLTAWSRDNLTYEGTYWRWIERAHLAGLRLMVMGVNENRELCELQANRETNCNEMDTVRRGFAAIKELQDYVDAQAGGPGRGFFQIVTDPYEARRVINQGRMAVILEIEISEPFDCRGWEQPTCDREQVDRQLEEMHRLGVRSMLLLNKFDNPLAGVRFDSGEAGVIINEGNKRSSGSYWSARTCREGELTDNEIFQPQPELNAGIASLLSSVGIQGGTAPTYPPAPHCNTRGLTELGRHVVRRMMDLNMIVNPDHMSQAGVDDTLTLLESRRYSGVISPHGWMDPGNWPRLWQLGGLAFPGHSSAQSYVEEWERYRPRRTPYAFGWGYGADLGGLSHQPDPPQDRESIDYPFSSYDGKVTFDRQRTGERTFDYKNEGVAHYGLYADWFEDLRRLGGKAMERDMWAGAEAYLQMWERAAGVPAPGCAVPREPPVTRRGLNALRLGIGWRRLLRTAGQPQQRTRTWTWCVRGKRNKTAADVAVLGPKGKVQLVGSTARGRRSAGVRVGQRTTRRGVRVRRTRRGVWISVSKGRRIRAVAVATRALARRPKALRAAVRRLRRAKATQAPRVFEPSRAQEERRLEGRALAGTRNRRLDAALALLCSLQVQGRGGR